MRTDTRPVSLAPSILAADFSRLGAEMQEMAELGCEILHIDVMDGVFVPPITFGDAMVSVAKTHAPSLYREVHLMTVEPGRHIEQFASAGAERLILHVEAESHTHRVLSRIRELKVSPGISLNPGTPIEAIFEVLDLCDLVLVMTVNPGWGGQRFIDSSLSKINRIKEEITRRGLPTLIEVDGGINEETGKRCVAAGADILVAGSYIFSAANRREKIEALRRI